MRTGLPAPADQQDEMTGTETGLPRVVVIRNALPPSPANPLARRGSLGL
ncbi:hypothetical protein HVPorG_04981 [Roseomonas mucosa]|nr:hypothetical protein ADP8_04981 [Roseomonas mucosa]QDJ08405.1 hypothetical protein HVPorG_04981 [Roseomonas mucosa]UZO90946.1 hypothetical protein RMP42_04981 [Roseomonas mucosa]UZO95793.1 hypothetical protein RMHFA_04981 [Roseomonas mucosa]